MTTTTAKKTATRKPAAKKATPAKAPAKKTAAAPKVKKSDIPEEDRDWTYLAEKEPTDLHEDFAKWLEDKTGIEVDLKTLQAVCVMRMVYQRSTSNKKRSTYRPLAAPVVNQRSKHMIQAHQDARVEIEKATPVKKAAPAKKTTAKAPAGKATATRARTRRPAAKKA